MIEAKPASFRFEKFRMPEFTYKETNTHIKNLKLKFAPSGKYTQADGRFELKLIFIGFEETEDNPVINVTMLAGFKFDDNMPFENIPKFFYTNSIAIAYPYIRSFVSSLTLQANVRMVLLELLNLSSLEEILKKNTEIIGGHSSNPEATIIPAK